MGRLRSVGSSGNDPSRTRLLVVLMHSRLAWLDVQLLQLRRLWRLLHLLLLNETSVVTRSVRTCNLNICLLLPLLELINDINCYLAFQRVILLEVEQVHQEPFLVAFAACSYSPALEWHVGVPGDGSGPAVSGATVVRPLCDPARSSQCR